jgi:hypothetical protein
MPWCTFHHHLGSCSLGFLVSGLMSITNKLSAIIMLTFLLLSFFYCAIPSLQVTCHTVRACLILLFSALFTSLCILIWEVCISLSLIILIFMVASSPLEWACGRHSSLLSKCFLFLAFPFESFLKIPSLYIYYPTVLDRKNYLPFTLVPLISS